jgi:heme exporter protein A
MNSETTNNILSATNLQCVRGERVLFKDISFNLARGSLLYIEGANGSGKTTLLRTLCGLSLPHGGSVYWNGAETKSLAEDYSSQVLYVGHLAGIKDELTPIENLQFIVSTIGTEITRDEALAALTKLNIARCADLPTRVLSQGQKRRVALARLWLQECPLWILDEPFTALDRAAIVTLTAHIENFTSKGGIVIFTSHQEPAFSATAVQHLLLD